MRFIDAFVAQLDLSKAGFTNAQLNETGRPPYDPGDLLRLLTTNPLPDLSHGLALG